MKERTLRILEFNKIKNKFSMDVVLESLEKYYLNVKEQYEKSKSSMG